MYIYIYTININLSIYIYILDYIYISINIVVGQVFRNVSSSEMISRWSNFLEMHWILKFNVMSDEAKIGHTQALMFKSGYETEQIIKHMKRHQNTTKRN